MSTVKNMNKQKYDLTSGDILSKLLLIALPIMGTQLMQMAYNLTDMFWLGKVSSDAVAASGSAGMYLWLSMGLLLIGRMGAEIGVSQNLGRGEKKEAMKFASNALFLALIFGIFFGLVLIIFNRPLIGFFNIQEAHVVKYARDYLIIVAIGAPFSYISGALNGAFNGAGNSRLPFVINGIGLVINMILDPVLILAADMGIIGAAIATTSAQIFVAICFLVMMKKSSGRPFDEFAYREVMKPEKRHLSQIFKWSIPVALESLFFTSLSMIVSRMVASYGASAIAIQKVGSQIESLSWLIGGGFATALTSFIGQNFGAGKWNRINEGFKSAAKIMLVWGIVVTVALYFGGEVVFSLFLPEPELVKGGGNLLRIFATCQIAICFESLSAGAFRGIGRTMPPSIIATFGNVCRVPICYALAATSLGLNGIWLGVALSSMLKGVIIFIWYLLASRKFPKGEIVVG